MKKNKNYIKRESYLKKSQHILDNYKNLGYNYKGEIFRRNVSSLFYLDKRKENILNEFEKFIIFLIEYTKTIKKSRNYAIEKDSTNIN